MVKDIILRFLLYGYNFRTYIYIYTSFFYVIHYFVTNFVSKIIPKYLYFSTLSPSIMIGRTARGLRRIHDNANVLYASMFSNSLHLPKH